MKQLAIVANCRSAWPDAAEIDALGITGIRTIVYDDDELDRALQDTPPHVRIVAMLNNEHKDVRSDWSGWRKAITAFARRFEGRVSAVECGNELDLWGLPPEKGAHLVREAFLPLSNCGMLTIMGGVAGENWQSWLDRACDLSQGWYSAVSLHPYGQRPRGFREGSAWGFGNLDDAIYMANSISGTPVYLTEWGVKVGDAGGVEGQADYLRLGAQTIAAVGASVVPFAAYFAWADKIGTEHERDTYNAFGLRDMQMQPRLAWHVYRGLMAEPTQEPKPVQPKTYTMEDVHRIRWQAVVKGLEYRHDFGIPTAWRSNPHWGSPLADEIALEDGRVVQPFVNAIVEWVDGEARTVES